MFACVPFRLPASFFAMAVSWPATGAPVIDLVRHAPAIPGPAETVRVEARTQGSAATLRWRLDGGTYQSLPMLDTDGDGKVEATVSGQSNAKVIEFFIDATDGTGTATWPSGSTGALWQTDASAPAGPWTPGAQPFCFVVLRELDRTALSTSSAG